MSRIVHEHDLSDAENALINLMSWISEESYAASWMMGLEQALWELHEGRFDPHHAYEWIISWEADGLPGVSVLSQLRRLVQQTGCWPRFVERDELEAQGYKQSWGVYYELYELDEWRAHLMEELL